MHPTMNVVSGSAWRVAGLVAVLLGFCVGMAGQGYSPAPDVTANHQVRPIAAKTQAPVETAVEGRFCRPVWQAEESAAPAACQPVAANGRLMTL